MKNFYKIIELQLLKRKVVIKNFIKFLSAAHSAYSKKYIIFKLYLRFSQKLLATKFQTHNLLYTTQHNFFL